MSRRSAIGASAIVLALAVSAVALEAHDLFLRPRDFTVREGVPVQLRVLNGGFASSESIVDADRLRDLTVAGPTGQTHPAHTSWSSAGKESSWTVTLGTPGTYVLGASLSPKTIRLKGAQFSSYLREEGLTDVLDARRVAKESGAPAHERYAKHVKSLVRVTGASSTPGQADTAYRFVLGYPAELIPMENPYALSAGSTLRVRALVDGSPTERQVVISGGRTTSGEVIPERQVRTDRDGIARIALTRRGSWYVKFIHMSAVPPAASDSVNYESKWATLTFALP